MYLKSLEISGFKSFAKKVDLDFTSTVSAIVGPNGSGKSNIAEAFRFVLGEQSIKSLRGKRGEDLIWNGSSEIPKAAKASVKVTFDNTTRFLNLDFDTVVIERAVHRDGVNEYFLNGSQVRLKDIIELLAGAHVGSTGHHIISQGEADRILNASVRERKAIIEDALGLKVYQYKKIESIKKLEKTRENITQVESLRKEIAPHIKFLKKQVEKVEKAVAMKEELGVLASKYFAIEKAYFEKTGADIREAKNPLEKKLETVRTDVAHAKDVLQKAEGRDNESDELLGIEEKLREVRGKKDEYSRGRGRIEGELAAAARMLKKQEEVEASKEWRTVEMQAVEDLRDEVMGYADTIEKSNNIDEIKKAIAAIKSLFTAFIEMRRDTKDAAVLMEAKKDIERLSHERDMAEEHITECIAEEKKLERAYADLRKKMEEEKEIDREAEKKLFQSMAEEKVVLSELQALSVREESLRQNEEEYKRDISEISVVLGKNMMTSLTALAYNDDRHAQKEMRQQMEKLRLRIEDSGALQSDDTLKEYRDATERDEFLGKELIDLSISAESLTNLISELDGKIAEEFETGLAKINTQFKEFFITMFGGGTAELSVLKAVKKKKGNILDDMDMQDVPESEEESDDGGIDISVSLPRKKVKGLIQLSGGERALTSIALLFALSQVNPPPFIILDETDAALDEANAKKYGDMIQTLSKFSQLIVITHNRETMSRAGVLYGVTMGSGSVSKILSIAFEEAVAVAK